MNKASEIRPGTNIYLSGHGKLHELTEYLAPFSQPVIITGEHSYQAFSRCYPGTLSCPLFRYDGSSSEQDAQRLATAIGNTDLIIAIGGGRVLDTGKMTAQRLGCPIFLIPTLVSNCAPYAPVITVYHPDRTFKAMGFLSPAASLTLVDWQLALSTPRDYFVAGIGDTLAKWYEIDGITRQLTAEQISAPVRLGIASAKEILRILLEDSQTALADLQQQRLSPAFGRVTDAIIALAGAVGGFAADYGRTAGAHAIHNGMSFIPATHSILHGAKVAYGILVQLAYTGDTEEIRRLLPFYKTLGLPCTLRELNINSDNPVEIQKIAEFAARPEDSFRLIDAKVTAQSIVQAIARVEQITH